ncbi:glycosyltransferase [Tenacibaculum dicentrarchi]|uniref:glycosyltransferase n=1 Tax=Tenacibaculum dicentrarchi TaxID=669041 RepID=UPI0035141C08
MINPITFVLTSCDRHDLLELTLLSFIENNKYPIAQYIFIEDSPKEDSIRTVLDKFPELKGYILIVNNPKLGQMRSIDLAYSYVKTEYIFHCEDDWKFLRSNFIEESLSILEENKNIMTVWLREQSDTNGHPIEKTTFSTKTGVDYKLMATKYLRIWHGFTLNPGLRRLSDYKKVGLFYTNGHEGEASVIFHSLNFRGAILNKGAIEHEGWNRHIQDTVHLNRDKTQLRIKSFFRKVKKFFSKRH